MTRAVFNPQRLAQTAAAERQRLGSSLRRLILWCLLALLAWAGMAALLAALDLLGSEAGAVLSVPSLLAQVRNPSYLDPLHTLARMTAETLAWPLAVVAAFVLLRGLLGEFLIRRMLRAEPAEPATGLAPPIQAPSDLGAMGTATGAAPLAPGEQAAPATTEATHRLAVIGLQVLKVVPMAAAAFGAIWAAMAAFAHFDGRDHWEALPWVTPPYLAEFLARHPGLKAERGARTGSALTLSNAQGHSIPLDGYELVRAELSLQSCPAGLGPAQLGGIEPYPGMACHTWAQLRRADTEQWSYLFKLARGSDNKAMEAHFRRWIDAHASGSGMSSSKGHITLGAGSRDEHWHLELRALEGGAATLRIRNTR